MDESLVTDAMLLEGFPLPGTQSARRNRRQAVRKEAGALGRIRAQCEHDLKDELGILHTTEESQQWSEGYQHCLKSMIRMIDREREGEMRE